MDALDVQVRALESSAVRRVDPGARGVRALKEHVAPSGLWVPRSFGNDLSAAVRRASRPLGVAALSASLMASSCGPGNGVTPPPPIPPGPDGGPLYVCLDESAAAYEARRSLPFSISAYDSNDPGCFTEDERSLVDRLDDIYDREIDGRTVDPDDETAITVGTLQGIVDRFVTVGPVIPHAVWRSYEEFVKERVYDPELEFNAGTIGVVDLHQMLPVWSLPSRFADPSIVSIDPVLDESPTDFPINYAVGRTDGPDWANDDPAVFLSGLKKFAGIDACNNGENILNTASLDMLLHRDFDPSSPVGGEILWHAVSLPTLPGAHVTVEAIFIERRGPYEHDRANISLREHVHPYDRTLVDMPWRDHLLGHVTPDRVRYFSADDFPFSEGDVVTPSDVELFVTPYMPAFLLDYVLAGPPDFGVGYGNEFFAVDDPIGPARGSGKRVIDFMMARFYPEGIQVRAVQPRYAQNFKVLAPCTPFTAEPTIR